MNRPHILPDPTPAPHHAAPWLAIAPVTGQGGAVMLPTHPLHGIMRRGLLGGLAHEPLRWATGTRAGSVRVARDVSPTGPALGQANLLRTHLDLLDQARRTAEPGAGFGYDLDRALDRMGYQRLADGGFHPATQRSLARRLGELETVRLTTRGGQGPELANEPFWRLEAPADGGRIWRAVPGGWWGSIELDSQRHGVGAELLAMPLDGHGHQVQRITLLLATELAGHEPHKATIGLGTLLERARVTSRESLLADAARRLNTPKRLREYLAGEGFADEGALALLRGLGYGIDIRDEEAFWASGRGWVERFWSARLRLEPLQPMLAQPLAS